MALDSSIGIVGYLALFSAIGFAFIFVNLLVGHFVRPDNPHAEKQEIYECGEPAIGSSYVQFDLRFYVVALVFIIFDVEVAFLFPWATVFGKTTNLMQDSSPLIVATADGSTLSPAAEGVYRELGARVATSGSTVIEVSETALREGIYSGEGAERILEFAGLQQIVGFSVVAISIFFVVLLVGFAYEWRTGALDWVRAMTQRKETVGVERTIPAKGGSKGSVLSA